MDVLPGNANAVGKLTPRAPARSCRGPNASAPQRRMLWADRRRRGRIGGRGLLTPRNLLSKSRFSFHTAKAGGTTSKGHFMKTLSAFVLAFVLATGAAMAQGSGGAGGGTGGGTEFWRWRHQHRQGSWRHESDAGAVRQGLGLVHAHEPDGVQCCLQEELAVLSSDASGGRFSKGARFAWCHSQTRIRLARRNASLMAASYSAGRKGAAVKVGSPAAFVASKGG